MAEKITRRNALRGIGKLLAGIGATTGLIGSIAGAIDHKDNEGHYRVALEDKLGLLTTVAKDPETEIPYSAFEKYAELEEKLLDLCHVSEDSFPRPRKKATKVADRIADKVAKRVLGNSLSLDIKKATAKFDRTRYMTILAEEIAREGIFYHGEELLSNSFNEKKHEPGQKHLDCDLLTYLMMHVGRKHNINMRFVPAPFHTYLAVESAEQKNAYHIIEATAFKDLVKQLKTPHYKRSSLYDSGFFTTMDDQVRHQKNNFGVNPEFAKLARHNELLADTDFLEANMEANILSGIGDYAERTDDRELQETVVTIGASKLEDKSKKYWSPTLAHNIYVEALDLSNRYISDGNLKGAKALFDIGLRVRKANPKVVAPAPGEKELSCKLKYR